MNHKLLAAENAYKKRESQTEIKTTKK